MLRRPLLGRGPVATTREHASVGRGGWWLSSDGDDILARIRERRSISRGYGSDFFQSNFFYHLLPPMGESDDVVPGGGRVFLRGKKNVRIPEASPTCKFAERGAT